jgi:6-phosphofructokinase 1
MRIGIMTGGGDCSGLNAVIRAVAKTLLLHHDAEIIGFEEGFLGLIENRWRPLDYRAVSGILDQGGTILGTHNKANPLNYFGADGADVSDQVIANYKALELDGIVVIGGDGTMSIANAMVPKGLKFVGVPKTIDNDLMATDRTFGFDTAVAVATEAIDRLQTTGQSHNRIMILETMGRYAGWIAAEAGLAGGADVVLIPEIPYDLDEVVRVCEAREDRQKFTIIVVAEGAKMRGGKMVVRETVEDSPDPVRLGGIGNFVKAQLEDRGLDSEIRVTVLGHIQRGGTPTASDRVLGTNYGVCAANLVVEGRWGHMVALQSGELTSVPIGEVADKTRGVPLDSPLVKSAIAVGMSFGVPDLDP